MYTALLNGRPVDSLLPDASAAASGADAAGTSEAGPASEDGVPGGATPAGPAVSGSIHLTMPLTAFLGSGREPGEVAGHGPVDAATSRDLAAILARSAGTRWCLTLTGPGGRAAGHACAPAGPADGQPVIRWAAGLRDRAADRSRPAAAATPATPPATSRPALSATSSESGSAAAPTPAAAAPPPAATSTTPSPTTTAAAPANATSRRYADITIGVSRPTAGTSTSQDPAR